MWTTASFFCHCAVIGDYTGLDGVGQSPVWSLDVNKGHSKHEKPAAAARIVWNSALYRKNHVFIHGRSAL